MSSIFKKNLGIILILMVSGLQFFSYIGSVLVTPTLLKSLHGYTSLKTSRPFLMDWVWVTVIGRIIGAYVLCKLALHVGFFKVMRIMVIAHILLAILISTYNFTGILLYRDIQFMFLHRSLHAFFIPASFMLPSLFLLNQRIKTPIMLSAYTCLSVGLGTLLLYKYLAFVQFCDGWYNIIFYASVVSSLCYIFAEKLLNKVITHQTPFSAVKLPLNGLFLVCTFGGLCGISFSYHFAFVDSYINEVLISNGAQNASFSYFYYALLVAIIPIARFIYAKSIFTPLKFSALGICLLALIITTIPVMTLNMYIAEQIIFGFLVAMLLAPCHALVYQLFENTHNYLDGMFWFVSCFTLFAITPHFFRKLLGIQSLAWLSILYLVPIALLFIFALSRYEREVRMSPSS